jgi:antitoxin (DNA-binding transcriptional repressor) of toxin-antitoxin stability system
LVAHLLWEQRVAGSNPVTPTHKTHFMKMNQELNELQTFTIEKFQDDFDNLMNRVENGESFIITSEHGNAVIVPYNEVVQVFQDARVDDDVIRIHTDHEEGS